MKLGDGEAGTATPYTIMAGPYFVEWASLAEREGLA
jgi:hypothetical protein